jgi:hypothetical protein
MATVATWVGFFLEKTCIIARWEIGSGKSSPSIPSILYNSLVIKPTFRFSTVTNKTDSGNGLMVCEAAMNKSNSDDSL